MLASAMGWIGTIGGISAYVLLSRGRWDATSLRYSLLNFVAGALAGAASAVYGAWPSVGSNVLWCAIAVHSAVTTLRKRRARAVIAEPASFPDHTGEPPPADRQLLAAA
ncbi:CBU_0592 family membrane protein [Nocardioides speluncae]|uniref:CBU_0592 family membrane protein n=1 Tax=Nocardioides speluncae TaxID=2670337 RepID=UPI0012B170BE|nr:hypothetical protein [Nocardioides speluncae]